MEIGGDMYADLSSSVKSRVDFKAKSCEWSLRVGSLGKFSCNSNSSKAESLLRKLRN
jgi:hypothetical protein